MIVGWLLDGRMDDCLIQWQEHRDRTSSLSSGRLSHSGDAVTQSSSSIIAPRFSRRRSIWRRRRRRSQLLIVLGCLFFRWRYFGSLLFNLLSRYFDAQCFRFGRGDSQHLLHLGPVIAVGGSPPIISTGDSRIIVTRTGFVFTFWPRVTFGFFMTRLPKLGEAR